MRLRQRLEPRPGQIAGLVLVAAALLPPTLVASGPPLCPFRLLTGLPCPGCGLTRSLVCLLHGDLAMSLAFHPLGPPVALALLVLVLAEGRGGASPLTRMGAWLESRHPYAVAAFPWATLAAFLLVWLVRLPLYLQGRWLY